VADPSYAWNAGIFLFSAAAMLDELAKFEPGIGPACKAAIDQGSTDNINAVGFQRLHPKEFAKAKAMSLDYAIMERTQKSAVIPMDAQWTDVGSWSSLWATCVDKESNPIENREARNFTHGSVELDDVKGCYLSTDGPLVAAIGVRDLCIVATEDAVLVLPMDQAQNVGKMAKKLKQATKTSRLAIKHRSEYKPWGSMRELSTGSNYRVIELTIKAGAATSLQMHYHRAMHQVVVKGTALMYQGDEKMLLQENQSAFVPIGMKHRLANPGSVPLVVMEVQSGSYLGNDDIVRIEDPVAQVAGTPRGLPTMAAGAGPHKPALVKVGEDQDHFSVPKTVVVESHNGAFFLQMFGAMAVGAVIAVQFMNRK
jgi:mannose-1-phosphate guanylyltransferase/mannose-6-phosphate isomerase